MTSLTFIVTVDPIKGLDYLDILTKSLNLQTRSSFDVVFYNQRKERWPSILDQMHVQPQFPHQVVEIDRDQFFGSYPLWDLYRLHSGLLERDEIGDYFMALHMEEFLDVDYVEQVQELLAAHRFDVLFGNLSHTRASPADLSPLLACDDAAAFDRHLSEAGLKRSPHWGFAQNSWSLRSLRHRMLKAFLFGNLPRIRATRRGYWKARRYLVEDVYWMSKSFARRYNWFLAGHAMCFEDIHICEQPGVCELSPHLKKLTSFPVYFDRRRIYHLQHGRYYFQFENKEFADRILSLKTDDPILVSLKKAIFLHRQGKLSLQEAIRYSRRNPDQQGSQNLNYKYHRLYLP